MYRTRESERAHHTWLVLALDRHKGSYSDRKRALKWVLPYGLHPSGKTKGSTLKWVLSTTLRVYGLRPSGKTTGSTAC
jgi:hypothetical protein